MWSRLSSATKTSSRVSGECTPRCVLSCLVLPCLVHRLPLLRALLISCRRHRFGAARVLLPAAHSTPTRLDGQRWHTRHESATTLCRARLAATTTQREASRECHRIGHTSASASIRTPLESSGHLSLQWRLAGGRVRHILSCLVLSCLVYRSGWAAVQSYDGGSSVAVLTDRARGAASLGDGSLEYILHRHATGGNGA
jgi:hypothetical protein